MSDEHDHDNTQGTTPGPVMEGHGTVINPEDKQEEQKEELSNG